MKTLNINATIKVKPTPFGAEIYYHRFDEMNQIIEKNHGEPSKSTMPKIDGNGFTKFRLWEFIQLYGKYIGPGMPSIITDGNFYIDTDRLPDI